MYDEARTLCGLLEENAIPFIVLRTEPEALTLLFRPEDTGRLVSTLRSRGWKKNRDASGDIFLYGMNRFLYFSRQSMRLTACFQIACRSTLHGEWVPLDRKINNGCFDRMVRDEDGNPRLSPEDMLCYLLADCVYTRKAFSTKDIGRIEACAAKTNAETLLPKLQGVFFRFSGVMLTMIEKGQYERIISELYAFSDY